MSGWELKHGKDLKRISAELRKMDDREVLKRFRRELRAAAAPMVPAVRASIANIPVKGTSGSTGLRQRLQKATRLEMRTAGRMAGIRIRVDGRKMPEGQGSLPSMMEGLKPWRHPVYARAGTPRTTWTWTGQDPHAYFYPVMRRLGLASRVAVNRAMNQVTKDIT